MRISISISRFGVARRVISRDLAARRGSSTPPRAVTCAASSDKISQSWRWSAARSTIGGDQRAVLRTASP